MNLGFGDRCTTDDLASLINEILNKAKRWGQDDPVITSQDIKTAFDNIEHQEYVTSLLTRGLTYHIIAAIYRETMLNEAVLDIPQAGKTDPADMEKSGVQGRGETPICFRLMTEATLEEAVREWDKRGFGVELCTGRRLNHLLYADNLWLIAANQNKCKRWWMMPRGVYARQGLTGNRNLSSNWSETRRRQ